jgi:hypothetical protein
MIRTLLAVLIAVALAPPLPAADVTKPKDHFGFDLGDDYCLANYKQYAAYLRKIEKETDRLKVVSIGKTEEGRDQLMAIVTSPANHKKLDRYRDISRTLATVGTRNSFEVRKLAEEGRAVVWIDGGLHANETLCAQSLAASIYDFVSSDDPAVLRTLDDVIILFVHCNPDGHDLVADWYMREKDPKKRSLNGLPRLYEKYAGHDNNRDFYAANLRETQNMNRVMYREWLPQIVLNHHQTGPAGAVMFIPPCRDPFNYNIHPLVINGIERVSHEIVGRFIAENKPGVTIRTGARYSTWFNGGLSTACQFHNMIGLFTETIGGPTPSRVPLIPSKQLPNSDYLLPIVPDEWSFGQSVRYLNTANRAITEYAARQRSTLLWDIWSMGFDNYYRGCKDSWKTTPKTIAAKADTFTKQFRDPAKREPRGYILPSDQPDFLTATKFVNTLIGSGLTVHRATKAFEVAKKKYPAGSFVILSAQAFRPHLFDMMEPQDHPDDFAPGSTTPTAPYDMAGWTLAFQMGVKFDRLLDEFEGPFEELKDEVTPARGTIAGANSPTYLLDGRTNDSFRAANQLLAAGVEVRRLTKPLDFGGRVFAPGTFVVANTDEARKTMTTAADKIGVSFDAGPKMPEDAAKLKPVRVGLWDRYGGSMPAGWTRQILERFEFPHKVVYPPQLDRGGLRESFDVLVFVEGAIPGGRGVAGKGKGGGGGFGGGFAVPDEFKDQQGNVTANATIPHLKEFLKEGGTIIAIGSSATAMAGHLDLPVTDFLTQKDKDGNERTLGRDKFYVPGSVLQTKVDNASPLAWGMGDTADVMFSGSPTFRIGKDAKDLKRVAWYADKTPLRSGWAWGQENLADGTAVIDATVGKGRLVMCGPQVLFRGQPHGTFKFLFNGIVGPR